MPALAPALSPPDDDDDVDEVDEGEEASLVLLAVAAAVVPLVLVEDEVVDVVEVGRPTVTGDVRGTGSRSKVRLLAP
jgi:hypothetical protein